MTWLRNNRHKLWRAASVLGAVLLWQVAAMLLDEELFLPSPFKVLVRLGSIWQEEGFSSSVWFSFARILLGFFLGLLVGVLLGILAGRFRFLETVLWPYMTAIKAVPVASFIIIAIVLFSTDWLSTVISFLMVLPVVYTNLLDGIKSLDPRMNEMAKVYGISFRRRLLYIWLPQIKPFLLAACRLSLGLAFKAGIAAEIIGLPEGSIGEALYYAKVWFLTVDLFAWTVVIVLLSVGFEKLFTWLLRWGFALWEKRS